MIKIKMMQFQIQKIEELELCKKVSDIEEIAK